MLPLDNLTLYVHEFFRELEYFSPFYLAIQGKNTVSRSPPDPHRDGRKGIVPMRVLPRLSDPAAG